MSDPHTETLEQAESTSRYARFALALLTLVYTFNFIDRQILTILLEPVKRELGASDTQMGFLAGPAFAVFYTLAGVPIARWADRGVRRDILALGLALWSGMTVLSGLSRSYVHLALARIGVGVGEATCSPAAHSLIADYFPARKRASAMAVYSTGIHAGILCGLMLGGWISHRYDWRMAFVIAGLPGLALAAVVRAGLREPLRARLVSTPARAASEPFAASLRALWEVTTLRFLVAGAAVTSIVGYAFSTWSAPYLERVHGLDSQEVGLRLGLVSGLGGAAGSLLGGILTDRWSRRDPRWQVWLPALGALLAAPCFALFTQASDATSALLVLIPAQVFQALWLGPVFSLTQGLTSPARRALASSLLLLVVNLIGYGLGPLLVGVLNDFFSARLGPSAIRLSLLSICALQLPALALWTRAARTLRPDLARTVS